MIVTPVFNQINSSVYVLSTLADTGLNGYWAGYFAGPLSNLGTSATTSQVWQDIGGFYLFLDKTPADWNQFALDLSALRSKLGPPNVVRFVWISHADVSFRQWQITPAYASAAGNGNAITWTLIRSAYFTLDAYLLSLPGLNTLTYIPDQDGGGIGFSGNGTFGGPAGAYTFTGTQIAFSGSTLGIISGIMNIPLPADDIQSDVWTVLNIGLQYAMESAPDETDHVATQMLFMPVFGRQTAAFSFGLSFDPLILSRTALSLFPSSGTVLPEQESFLRTTRGYPIRLTPLAGRGAIPDARFVLGYSPVLGDQPEDGYRYHFSPDGAFQLSVEARSGATGPYNLMPGLSGLEYASFGDGDHMIVFEGNKPAFIPFIDKTDTVAPDISNALTNAAITSYMTVLAAGNQGTAPVYYAQPREAPVFSGHSQRTDNVLDFNPMPSYAFSYNTSLRPPVFPMGVYAGLTGDDVVLAREMENGSLAPFRNYCIGLAYNIHTFTVPQRRLRDANDPLGVTPNGLLAELTPDYSDFDGLILGNMPGTAYPTIDLTAVTGMFKQSLQSNQLFFVAANADVLMSATSIRYQLTDESKPWLLLAGVTQAVIDAVYATSGSTQLFDTEALFVACIGTAAGTSLPVFLKVAGLLKVEMDGWTFQLSPRSWRVDPDHPGIMIAKFCNRSLMDLANDSGSWSWPDVATPASGSLKQTQTVLLKMFDDAAAADLASPLSIFYNTVLIDPNWNGFLFLNAPVDISALPDDLKFLTAGIDLTKFYAHHIGFSQTSFSVSNGVPQLEQTAAFGLINYEDPLDLYAEETIPFSFKTMKMRARFANAALADFSAEVELMLNELLVSPLSKQDAARGNNLIIEGAYQRVGGAPSYAFTLTGQNVFNVSNTALTQIEVLAVQLITGGDSTPQEVLTTFILMGNLRFFLLSPFDLFSFGPDGDDTDSYLRYNGLCIDMRFSITTPGQQTFNVRTANMGFDVSASTARVSSLFNNFPLTITSLVAGPNQSAEGETPTGQTPEDLGYTSISAPLDQVPMIPGWYGLVFTLDLGTFGALTGSVGFKISILAAWSKGASQEDNPVYLGLKLPGISAIAGSFPLQGVLKLGFRSFQFETYTTDDGLTGYLLRLRHFALSVLVWSFPPGNTDIVLFGQPGNPGGSLGWYAAYDGGEKKNTRLKSERRTPPVV